MKTKCTILIVLLCSGLSSKSYGMAAGCFLAPSNENYLGYRYKALLAEDELSETEWLILFNGCQFTFAGEYQPHFVDLMIRASWADYFTDPLCSGGSPFTDTFSVEFGLSDYEDTLEGVFDNDIGMLAQDPNIFARHFVNIDSVDPLAPDKAMAKYQVEAGGNLLGREIEVIFERGSLAYLDPSKTYYLDVDAEGDNKCQPNNADIEYWQWRATLLVPSLGIETYVDFYVNAEEGRYLDGDNHAFNILWENYGEPSVETDKFKVIIFEPEVKTADGTWQKALTFHIDYRGDVPKDINGNLLAGYRKVNYKGGPALETSFGYGYTDYIADCDTENHEFPKTGMIDLSTPAFDADIDINGSVDFDDLTVLVNQWLQQPTDPSPDIAPEEGDNFVDLRDFGVLALEWLQSVQEPTCP